LKNKQTIITATHVGTEYIAYIYRPYTRCRHTIIGLA